MAEETLIEQFHLDIFQRAAPSEREAEVARRVLDSERFRRRLERVVKSVFRKHCALRRLRVSLSI
jgi:hypothetical protein